MTQYLLDTNIVSELVRPEPNAGVIRFLSENNNLWLSTITLHEIEYGLGLLPEGGRRAKFEQVMSEFFTAYHSFILPVDQQEAKNAAVMRASMKKSGKVLHLADSLIAGTASAHQLTVVTRNIKDFEGLGVGLLDPFSVDA